MRQVNLTGQPPSPGCAGQVEKLTGHLNARMEELMEDGLTVSHELQNGVGKIRIGFPHQESRKALRRLADFGIAAAEADHQVLFTVTDRISHEDLDYVQGAVMEILYD